MVIIPGYISQAEQRALVVSSLTRQARAPNETNLDTHYEVPSQGIWNCCHPFPSASIQPHLISPRSEPILGNGFRAEASAKRSLVENVPGEETVDLQADLPQPVPSPLLVPQEPLQLLPKLRWANIGRSYNWGAKAYDFTKPVPPFPNDVQDICQRIVRTIPWSEVWNADATSAPVLAEEWGVEGADWESWPSSFGSHVVHIK